MRTLALRPGRRGIFSPHRVGFQTCTVFSVILTERGDPHEIRLHGPRPTIPGLFGMFAGVPS